MTSMTLANLSTRYSILFKSLGSVFKVNERSLYTHQGCIYYLLFSVNTAAIFTVFTNLFKCKIQTTMLKNMAFNYTFVMNGCN